MDPSRAPDRSAAHVALQEVLRSADTFKAARDAGEGGALKRFLVPIATRLVHFFADRQVAWNGAAARSLEATIRAVDNGDEWIAAIAERVRALEAQLGAVEAELRGSREAEAEARRKLAIAGIRLRELEELQQALAKRLDGEGAKDR